MKNSLDRENQTNSAKRPIWQGCGCLVLLVIFAVLFSFSLYGVYVRSQGTDAVKIEKDPRKELLKTDMAKTTSFIQKDNDSLFFALKECIDYDIVIGLDTDKIAYFSKLSNDKLIILLQIEHIKQKTGVQKGYYRHCRILLVTNGRDSFYIGI